MDALPIGYRMAMAHVCRHFDAAPEDVFAVLVDAERYPDWLVGAAKIRRVDHNWPSPGSAFHHEVGVRPFVIPDNSSVIDVEPNRTLVLHVKARPIFGARVTFRITGDGDGCVLTCEEEPTIRSIGNALRPVLDPAIHARNQRSLRSMERLVAERKRERLTRAADTRA